MSKSLVIVESPAKAKTINKYLGKDYQVEASFGHIMDLPKRDIGVELENRTFEPTLIVTPDKEKVVRHLRKLAEKADVVYLAPDPDREGEAIAAHLAIQLLPVMKDKTKIRRVTFNEITQKAVRAAFEHARDVDENLVDAQQTRRVLDRIVAVSYTHLCFCVRPMLSIWRRRPNPVSARCIPMTPICWPRPNISASRGRTSSDGLFARL